MREPAAELKRSAVQAEARCACGTVRFEIDVPAFWVWHDHSRATRRAAGAAYMTWVGVWRRRLRLLEGEEAVARWEDEAAGAVRGFCARCGTPLFQERRQSPKYIDIPRGLFVTRCIVCGRQMVKLPGLPWRIREKRG